MARILAIDADGSSVALLAATIGRGGSVTFDRLLTWNTEGPPAPATAEALGRGLRERLAAAKIAAAPLLVCVGRERVVFKEIKHPAVPPADEPGVIRFQAVKELTEAADDVVIDYQPRPGDGPERRALVVAAKKEIVRVAQMVAQAAGLKLAGVVPRPFALAAAARFHVPGPDPGTAFGVLAVLGTGGEFLVARGDEILFARPVPAPALASDAALLGEIRRNLAVYSAQNSRDPVKSLFIAEGPALRGFASRASATIAIPVLPLDPAAGAKLATELTPGQIAAPFGLARLATGDLPINFIKPREPKPAVNPHRRPILFAASLAAALLFAAGALAYMQLSDRDQVIASLRRELDGIGQDLARLEPDARRADEVRKWNDSSVVWLDELYDLVARFPDLTKLRLTLLTADPMPLPPNPKPGVKPFVARVSIEGLTTDDSKPLTQFMNELAKESAYKVEAKNTKPLSFGADRRSFSNSFSTRFELQKRPPEDYTKSFTAEAPPRRSRGGGRPGGLLDAILGGNP